MVSARSALLLCLLLSALGPSVAAVAPRSRDGSDGALSGTGPGDGGGAAAAWEHRIDRILKQLTLEEKVSLMDTNSPAITRDDGVLIPAFNWWCAGSRLPAPCFGDVGGCMPYFQR